MKNLQHHACLFALLLPACAFAAQDKPSSQSAPAPQPAVVKIDTVPDYSKEALVWDQVQSRLRFETDGTGTRETTARIRIQADAGVKAFAVLNFAYTTSNQQIEIKYVRVKKPDGSTVVTPAYNVQDLPADVTRTAPMYSDLHEKHVAVKGLAVGDILEYQVVQRTLKPDVANQFWLEYSFEKDQIMLDEELYLDLPASSAARVISHDVQPTTTTASGRILYHWSSKNLARTDPDAPAKSVRNWKPSVELTTFKDWQQIGAWYDSLQQNSLELTPALRTRALDLTKGLKTDQEKAQAIYNDVALHIHYIGLEFGIGRYQPHPADDVFSNQYGDCKDKHTLLATMLKAVGIEAWPVLISANRYLDPEVPSPGQFNHVITLAMIDGKPQWMDTTSEVAPMGLLLMNLRDKQALAVPVGKQAYLVSTPADLPQPRLIHFEAHMQLSDQGVITGHIDESMNGDVAFMVRNAYRNVAQSQWKVLTENFIHSQNFGGEISNPQYPEVEKVDAPLHLAMDYKRDHYYEWDPDKSSHWIGPPMPSMGGELAPGIKEKQVSDPISLYGRGRTEYVTYVQLPAGWNITLPKNVDLVEDYVEYHAAYSYVDGVFIARRTLISKQVEVPVAQLGKFADFRRAMYNDWNDQALLFLPVEPKKHHLLH